MGTRLMAVSISDVIFWMLRKGNACFPRRVRDLFPKESGAAVRFRPAAQARFSRMVRNVAGYVGGVALLFSVAAFSSCTREILEPVQEGDRHQTPFVPVGWMPVSSFTVDVRFLGGYRFVLTPRIEGGDFCPWIIETYADGELLCESLRGMSVEELDGVSYAVGLQGPGTHELSVVIRMEDVGHPVPEEFSPKKFSCTVELSEWVSLEGLVFPSDSLCMYVGDTVTVRVSLIPAGASFVDVVWSAGKGVSLEEHGDSVRVAGVRPSEGKLVASTDSLSAVLPYVVLERPVPAQPVEPESGEGEEVVLPSPSAPQDPPQPEPEQPAPGQPDAPELPAPEPPAEGGGASDGGDGGDAGGQDDGGGSEPPADGEESGQQGGSDPVTGDDDGGGDSSGGQQDNGDGTQQGEDPAEPPQGGEPGQQGGDSGEGSQEGGSGNSGEGEGGQPPVGGGDPPAPPAEPPVDGGSGGDGQQGGWEETPPAPPAPQKPVLPSFSPTCDDVYSGDPFTVSYILDGVLPDCSASVSVFVDGVLAGSVAAAQAGGSLVAGVHGEGAHLVRVVLSGDGADPVEREISAACVALPTVGVNFWLSRSTLTWWKDVRDAQGQPYVCMRLSDGALTVQPVIDGRYDSVDYSFEGSCVAVSRVSGKGVDLRPGSVGEGFLKAVFHLGPSVCERKVPCIVYEEYVFRAAESHANTIIVTNAIRVGWETVSREGVSSVKADVAWIIRLRVSCRNGSTYDGGTFGTFTDTNASVGDGTQVLRDFKAQFTQFRRSFTASHSFSDAVAVEGEMTFRVTFRSPYLLAGGTGMSPADVAGIVEAKSETVSACVLLKHFAEHGGKFYKMRI